MSILSNGTLIGDRYGKAEWNVEEDGTVHLNSNAVFTHEGFARLISHLETIEVGTRNLHRGQGGRAVKAEITTEGIVTLDDGYRKTGMSTKTAWEQYVALRELVNSGELEEPLSTRLRYEGELIARISEGRLFVSSLVTLDEIESLHAWIWAHIEAGSFTTEDDEA